MTIISQYFNSGFESKVVLNDSGKYLVECYRNNVLVSTIPVSNQNLAENLAEDYVGIGTPDSYDGVPKYLAE